ncbi:hypothetical protein ACFTZB_23955 [Rhodococcus sp. NPDC057014]|uniref:hypothetical protein n=1 Tax=Rhodococcus sp. NPDC057014 TaxID=3346000 RepID=UPI0036459F17
MSASTRLQLVMLPAAAVSIAQAATTIASPMLAMWAFLIAGLGAHAWYRAAEPKPHDGRRPSAVGRDGTRLAPVAGPRNALAREKGTCHRRSWAA